MDELEQLRAEVARLRAGETDEPTHDGTELTVGQWIRRWNEETADERRQRVTHIRTAFQAWRECDEADHEGLLRFLRTEQAALVGQRDRYASAIARLILLHQARRTHRDLDAAGCQDCVILAELKDDPHVAMAYQRQMAAMERLINDQIRTPDTSAAPTKRNVLADLEDARRCLQEEGRS